MKLSIEELKDIVANAKTSLEQYLALELIAALKGDQVPDGYIFCHPDGKLFWSIVSESCANGKGVVPYYLTRQPSSVVVLPRKIEPWEVIDILDPTANPEDYACCVGADMYNTAIKACHKSLQSAGVGVEEGE